MSDEARTAAAGSGMPDFKQSVKLKYVKLGYHHLISHGAYLLLAPLPGLVAAHLSTFTLRDLAELCQSLQYSQLVSVLVCTTVLVVVATAYALTRPRPVYLVDFACYRPDDARRCSRARFMNCTESLGTFTPENVEFQRRIIERSGLGEDTYLPEGGDQHPARRVHGQREEGGGDGDVRRAGRAVRQDRGEAQGHRRAGGELQPLQPDAVAVRHGGEPIQAPGQRGQLQPRRHGLQRGAHRRGPGPGPAAVPPGHVRRGDQHGEHHPQLVPGQRPLHARVQLPVPHGRRGAAAVQPGLRAATLQVPAGAHGAHAQGRRRPLLRLRAAAGGRGRQGGRVAVQGAHGRGRGRAQDQHHDARPAGAAHVGAAALLRHAGGQDAAEEAQGEALHPGLQAGVRALLHPRRRPGGAGRAGEEPQAHGLAHGAVQDDAAPLRQHLQQLALVRARLRRGQGTDQEGRPHLADRLRLRVQVQQRRVEGAPLGEPGQGEGQRQPLDGRHRQLPRRRPQGVGHLILIHLQASGIAIAMPLNL